VECLLVFVAQSRVWLRLHAAADTKAATDKEMPRLRHWTTAAIGTKVCVS